MKHLSLFLLTSFFCISRLSAQTIDPGFGVGGVALVNHSADLEGPRASLLQKDGKILAGGYTTILSQKDFALIRLKPNGKLDSTFGTWGKVRTDVSSDGYDDGIRSLLLQSDDKIIAAGTSGFNGALDFSLSRYMPDGTLDLSFGIVGKVKTDIGGGNDEGWMAALQSDGKIILGGRTASSLKGWNFGVVRYLPNGALDPDFGENGTVITDIDNVNNELYALTLDPDGKILAAGYSGSDLRDILIVRYLNDGSVDETFGDNGFILTDLAGLNESIYNIGVDVDGNILVNGNAIDEFGQESFFLARYLPNGSPDLSFGIDGLVFSNFGNPTEHADAFVFLPDGKILVGGLVNSGDGNTASLFRYTATGAVDATFGQDGWVKFIKNLRPFDILPQEDGKMVCVGDYVNDGKYDFAAFRVENVQVAAFEAQEVFTQISLNPNPATDVINLSYTLTSTQKVSISLHDAQGKRVLTYFQGSVQPEGENRLALPLAAELPKGSYFLSLESATRVTNHKFVKM